MFEWSAWIDLAFFGLLAVVVKGVFDKLLNGMDFEDIWW